MVHQLIDDSLLRSVRNEILDNIHFTPKETDIYKIHQSGDLANLSGLPASALARLPSLLKLRDALYSRDFRQWIIHVSGAGPLSGSKTDMAVNVYVPGCHLLCHDDVIGTRRVSYILYLTDPDEPWQSSWGGALRLYPTTVETAADGTSKKQSMPHHQWVKTIPPAWNQLSFFAVQPGQSFHDVEEVYKLISAKGKEKAGGRVRMAISGWFHIPQPGEPGFEPGLEQRLAEMSSLQQLKGKADHWDLPRAKWSDPAPSAAMDADESSFSEAELDFLLKYMTPHYLTPDTVEDLCGMFADESSLQLANILSKSFSEKLRAEMVSRDTNQDDDAHWHVARPPYKHRYMYREPGICDANSKTPAHDSLINELLPSLQFSKWLALVTNLDLGQCTTLARRFRRSLDYTLATAHEDKDPQLEWCLNITPTRGWGAEEPIEDDAVPPQIPDQTNDDDNVGGYELFMAGEDDDEEFEDSEFGSDDGVEIPSGPANPSATGGGNRRVLKQKSKDPAVYDTGDDDDDGILFSNPASWNMLSIVLRDHGTLKFVKYVSHAAPGDRWDITGCAKVLDDDSEEVQTLPAEIHRPNDSADDDDGDDGDDLDEGDEAGSADES